ncbi:MAG: hypothetical protein KAV82_03205 [Phycisphaerae bacterium]|nr:hypothetical protein [Phycisphaerae bacterium]
MPIHSHLKETRPAGEAVEYRAFTFIESVVVVSVLGLLLTVLVPSVNLARSRDQMAGCLANLREIAAVSLVYATDDPNEIMIPVPNTQVLPHACGAIEWGGKSGKGQSRTGEVAESIFGTAAYRGPAHRPLNPYIYKGGFVDYNNPFHGCPDPGQGYANYLSDANLDLDIYRCPADTGYAGGGFLYTAGSEYTDRNEGAFRYQGRTAYDHYGTSYVANTFWIVGGYVDRIKSQSPYLTPLSSVPSPAHTIAYQEVPSRFAHLWGDWSIEGQCDYSDRVVCDFNTIPGWHGLDFNFNVAFVDGHAATVEMRGSIRPAPNLGPQNYPPSACGSMNDYACHRCVTFRGPGWQLDTLPAPAVLTPYYADKSASKRNSAAGESQLMRCLP